MRKVIIRCSTGEDSDRVARRLRTEGIWHVLRPGPYGNEGPSPSVIDQFEFNPDRFLDAKVASALWAIRVSVESAIIQRED